MAGRASSRLLAWPLKICGWLAVLLSVYVFCAGAWMCFVMVRCRLHARTAPGKVVALTMREELNEGSLYTLTFSFTDASGAAHVVKATEEAATAPEYAAGDPVKVLYDVKNPAQARIATYRDSWLAPFYCLAVGAVCIALSRILRRFLKEFMTAE